MAKSVGGGEYKHPITGEGMSISPGGEIPKGYYKVLPWESKGGGGGSSGGQSTVSSEDLQKRINELNASIELKKQQQEAIDKARIEESKRKEKEAFSKLNEQQKLAYLHQREMQRVAQEKIIKVGSVVEKYREMLPKGQNLSYYQ